MVRPTDRDRHDRRVGAATYVALANFFLADQSVGLLIAGTQDWTFRLFASAVATLAVGVAVSGFTYFFVESWRPPRYAGAVLVGAVAGFVPGAFVQGFLGMWAGLLPMPLPIPWALMGAATGIAAQLAADLEAGALQGVAIVLNTTMLLVALFGLLYGLVPGVGAIVV